jgi:hypothetical protein
LSWLRSQMIIRCGGTNGPSQRSMIAWTGRLLQVDAIERLLGAEISNLNRIDPSLQTPRAGRSDLDDSGTAFWLVGTLT